MIKKGILILTTFLCVGIIDSHASVQPIGTGPDAFYVLSGKADIFLVDDEGRASGYKNGHRIEEIPGVGPKTSFGGSSENRKEIYMSKRKDLKTVIVGTTDENYTLMIAGGNYYLKIEGVPTKKGQVDEIISKEDSIEINFDNTKSGTYSLMMDYFKYKNGTIFYPLKSAGGDYQKYFIDWEGVHNKTPDAVQYTVEKDTEEKTNKYNLWNYNDDVIHEDSINNNQDTIKIIIILFVTFISILSGILLYKQKFKREYIYISFVILLGVASIFYSSLESKKVICMIQGEGTKELGMEFTSSGATRSPYEVKGGKVYIKDYRGSTLQYDLIKTDISAGHFRVISSGYSRDNENIYFYGRKIEGAEYCSFEVSVFENSHGSSEGLARDKNNLYFRGKVYKQADPETFQRQGSFYFSDKNYVFDDNLEIIDWADSSTITYNDEKYFVYDKNGVYPDREIKIKGADGETFEKVGGYYYKDKNNIYWSSSIVEGADIETFEKISYEYYKDKNFVYFTGGKRVEGSDPDTFTKHGRIFFDKNGIYPERGLFIPGVDIETFKKVGGDFYKDKNNVYHGSSIFEGVDVETFETVKNGYYKDKNHVYYKLTILDGVDSESFKYLSIYTADKNHVYYKNRIIKDVDPLTFEYIGGYLGIDKNNVLYEGKIIEGMEPSMCTSWSICKENYPDKSFF